VPPASSPMTTGASTAGATITTRMAEGVKPYRLYRGGRKKGKVPLSSTTRPPTQPKNAPGAPTRRRRWGLWVVLAVVGLLVLAVIWGALGFRAFAGGVDDANKRLPRGAKAQLAKRDRSILSEPTTLLVIGTDGGRAPGRSDANRSDSMMLLHLDPETHDVAYLSIPRDLRVEIPGYGTSKINAANQIGGPALTIETVKALTGLPIDHVIVVDFDGFKELIDAIGGIEVNVPKAILSNRFDCPYKPARCAGWEGWRFEKGRQKMDGRRALIYARIRENRLDPSENDLTRGGRQQEVVEAMTDKIVGPSTFVRLPFIGDDLMTPLTTDLSPGQLLQLGWVKFRANASRALHCRLGGEPQSIGGESVLIATEENTAAIAMFMGRSAAQPPPPGAVYGAGCVIGTGRSG
jgi:LCP family protein required for cell wall assembly